jgi:hypothetical protein
MRDRGVDEFAERRLSMPAAYDFRLESAGRACNDEAEARERRRP